MGVCVCFCFYPNQDTFESEDDAINNYARTGLSGDCAGHTGIGGLVGDIFPEDMGKGEMESLGLNPFLKSLAGRLTSWESSGLLWG